MVMKHCRYLLYCSRIEQLELEAMRAARGRGWQRWVDAVEASNDAWWKRVCLWSSPSETTRPSDSDFSHSLPQQHALLLELAGSSLSLLLLLACTLIKPCCIFPLISCTLINPWCILPRICLFEYAFRHKFWFVCFPFLGIWGENSIVGSNCIISTSDMVDLWYVDDDRICT